MLLRLGLGASARAAFFSWIALACCALGCGDGDVIGDGGLGTQGATSVSTRCGDGNVSGSEQCDDGNGNSGDGCSSSCTREAPPVPGMDDAGAGAAGPGGNGGTANTAPDATATAADSAASSSADAGMDAAANGNGTEAGSADDASSAEDDASAPPAPEPLCPAEPPGPCEACNCTMCRTELDACTNLAGNAAEGPAQGMPKAALCEALVRCGRSTGCRSIGCVCGVDNQAACLMGETPPDGPCKDEVLNAAETTDMLTFLMRATMPAMGYAVAVASAVSTCAANACASDCAAP